MCLASVCMSKFGIGELLIMALRTLPLPGTSYVISLARTPTKLVQFSCPALFFVEVRRYILGVRCD